MTLLHANSATDRHDRQEKIDRRGERGERRRACESSGGVTEGQETINQSSYFSRVLCEYRLTK